MMCEDDDWKCPKCESGTLDTGGECNDCDYDKLNSKQNFVDGFKSLSETGSKEKIAAFLRKNTYGSA